jgi:hypothetical protein
MLSKLSFPSHFPANLCLCYIALQFACYKCLIHRPQSLPVLHPVAVCLLQMSNPQTPLANSKTHIHIPWLRLLIAHFWRRPNFDPRPVNTEFAINKRNSNHHLSEHLRFALSAPVHHPLYHWSWYDLNKWKVSLNKPLLSLSSLYRQCFPIHYADFLFNIITMLHSYLAAMETTNIFNTVSLQVQSDVAAP